MWVNWHPGPVDSATVASLKQEAKDDYLRAMQKSKEDYPRLIRQELDDIEKACRSPQLDALARNFLKRPRNRDGSALCDREFERDRDFYMLLLPYIALAKLVDDAHIELSAGRFVSINDIRNLAGFIRHKRVPWSDRAFRDLLVRKRPRPPKKKPEKYEERQKAINIICQNLRGESRGPNGRLVRWSKLADPDVREEVQKKVASKCNVYIRTIKRNILKGNISIPEK